MEKKVNKKYKMIILGLTLLILDQIMKFIIINKDITIIPKVLNLTYTQNTGVAFSISSDNTIIIIIFSIILIGIILKMIKVIQKDLKIVTLLTIILAGGISNLFDRVTRGYVIDFIDIDILNFPIFNFADICIVVGILLLVIVILKKYHY